MNIYPKYMLFTLFCIFLIFILITNSCDSTQPKNIKSPRDYTWEVDTVYNPSNAQTLMTSIWGSSENDIYMCGHSSGGNGPLWHYDGIRWENIDLIKVIGQTGGLRSVHGSSPNNVWVVGYQIEDFENRIYSDCIIKFDGAKWERQHIKINTSLRSIFVNDINDVWICGSDGIVAHLGQVYSDWEIDTIKIDVVEGAQYDLNSIVSNRYKTFVYGNVVEDYGLKNSFYIFERVNEGWTLIDSFIKDNDDSNEWGTNKLYFTSFSKLYSIGTGLWEKSNSSWVKKGSFNGDFRSFHERGIENMILGGSFGAIYHYNGKNWIDLDLPNDDVVSYRGIWMEHNSTTIIGHLLEEFPQKTIVFRGK